MAQFGRVVQIKGRKGPAIDFYPDLKGRQRYLYTHAGKAFADRAAAETVRERISERASLSTLAEAVDHYRRPSAERENVWKAVSDFLDSAEEIGSLRTGEPYSQRTLNEYRRLLHRAQARRAVAVARLGAERVEAVREA